ncbi:TolC family protein, partial [Pseudoxanthomonas sp. SGD-10]
LQAAKASESYYALNAELTEEQVIELTANNYYQVLVNREQLSVIDTNIKNIKVIDRIITDQYNNGLAKKIDVDRIKVNLTNLETQREQIVNAIEQLEIQLKLSMGMPISTTIVLPSNELRDINTLPLLENEIAVNNRTELRLLDVQRSLLDLQRKAYVSEYYPTLAITGNYAYTTMTNKFDPFKQKSAEQGSVGYDASAIGLTLRVPIFSGFRTRSKVKQAEIEILKAEEDVKATTNALNAAYENAKIQLRNSFNTIQAQRNNVRLAQEIYESTQNNYNNGLASLTDLLDTENSLTQAQNSYNQALLNYKIAEIQVTKSKGELKSLINE